MAIKVTGEQLLKEWEEAGKKLSEAQKHYQKIDEILKRYCAETKRSLVHCDNCGKIMFENPSEDFGKGNFLHWNFCSNSCREFYWRGTTRPKVEE